jgi:hypothetical protein
MGEQAVDNRQTVDRNHQEAPFGVSSTGRTADFDSVGWWFEPITPNQFWTHSTIGSADDF